MLCLAQLACDSRYHSVPRRKKEILPALPTLLMATGAWNKLLGSSIHGWAVRSRKKSPVISADSIRRFLCHSCVTPGFRLEVGKMDLGGIGNCDNVINHARPVARNRHIQWRHGPHCHPSGRDEVNLQAGAFSMPRKTNHFHWLRHLEPAPCLQTWPGYGCLMLRLTHTCKDWSHRISGVQKSNLGQPFSVNPYIKICLLG